MAEVCRYCNGHGKVKNLEPDGPDVGNYAGPFRSALVTCPRCKGAPTDHVVFDLPHATPDRRVWPVSDTGDTPA